MWRKNNNCNSSFDLSYMKIWIPCISCFVDGESVSDCSDMDTAALDLLYTRSNMAAQGRTGSVGSDTLSDDDISQLHYVAPDNSPKRKPTQKRRLKPGEQAKPQNRGRKPGQSKPCVVLLLSVSTNTFRLTWNLDRLKAHPWWLVHLCKKT